MRELTAQLRHLLFLGCCIAMAGGRFAAADEPAEMTLNDQQRIALEAFVRAAEKVRTQDYGNVHFAVTQVHTFQSGGTKTRDVTEINYWSRENQYFRLDSQTVESDDPRKKPGSRHRIVLGPDGFVGLDAISADSPLVITEWGSYEEGWESLGGNFAVDAAVRCGGLRYTTTELAGFVGVVLHAPAEENELKCKLTDVTLSKDGSQLVVKWIRSEGTHSTKATLRGDVEHGVSLEYVGEFYANGVFRGEFKEEKKYDFDRFGPIPSDFRFQLESVDPSDSTRRVQTFEFKARHVGRKPTPLGVFSLEAQGISSVKPESVWPRRMLTVCVGLVLLATYWAVKRVRTRATD